MKVSDAIRILQEKLDPDEEIIVQWWDKKCFARVWDNDEEDGYPPVESWVKAVREWEEWSASGENSISEDAWEWLHEALLDQMPNN